MEKGPIALPVRLLGKAAIRRSDRLVAWGVVPLLAVGLAACASSPPPSVSADPGSVGGLADEAGKEAIYHNAIFGFEFDPSFCGDLVKANEGDYAVVYTSESWGMRLYAQASENVDKKDAQALVDVISTNATVPDVSPAVEDKYLCVRQMEEVDGKDVVALYLFYVGPGSYQGIACEFDPDAYERLTEEQGEQLAASFIPGDTDQVHENLR